MTIASSLCFHSTVIDVCTVQAYYYEEMTQCPSSAMPDFGDSIDDLLLRLLSAQNIIGDMGRTSSAVIDVDITVSDLTAIAAFVTLKDNCSENFTTDVYLFCCAVCRTPTQTRRV